MHRSIIILNRKAVLRILQFAGVLATQIESLSWEVTNAICEIAAPEGSNTLLRIHPCAEQVICAKCGTISKFTNHKPDEYHYEYHSRYYYEYH